MNELTIFNKAVIPVYIIAEGVKVVIGRELHERLKIGTAYKDWFPRMCEYGFFEPKDFSSFLSESTGGRPSTEHLMHLDMAKHIAMIQRTPEGKEIRDKLISLETDISELSPELRQLINMEIIQKKQGKAIEAVNKRVDEIGNVIALNPNDWRDETRKIIVRISERLGGNEFIPQIYNDLYKLVDLRGGKRLNIRLTNLKKNLLSNGCSKSKVDRANMLDVIAEEKELREIFIMLVKEMAIKYGIGGSEYV